MNKYLLDCYYAGHAEQELPNSLMEYIKRSLSWIAVETDQRAEILDWLVGQDIPHYFEAVPFGEAPSGRRIWYSVLVLMWIPDDSDAFHFRLRYGIKPVPPEIELNDYEVRCDNYSF